MDKLTLADLYPLEAYATVRPEFRDRVIEHKPTGGLRSARTLRCPSRTG
jgi:hypothetical protein